MANAYDDTEIDAFIANLQSQINYKAATTELSSASAVHTTTTTSNTNRIAELESSVSDLQSMIVALSARVAELENA